MANEVKTGDRFIHGIFQKDETSGYGVGGINGMQHNFLGWKNTTVGIASSVFDNLLTQHGITTYDPNYIGALEPIRAGRFLVKWLRVPSFFDPIAISYLKFFLENAVREVSGITSNSLDSSGTVTWGGNQQEMDFPGSMKQGNKTVTLTTLTCSGDGLGKIYRYWQYGITDPVTGIHHLYGKDLRFIRPNYSGSLLYVFLGLQLDLVTLNIHVSGTKYGLQETIKKKFLNRLNSVAIQQFLNDKLNSMVFSKMVPNVIFWLNTLLQVLV